MISRAGKVGVAAALSLALFVLGGIGAFKSLRTDSDSSAVTPSSGALSSASAVGSGSLVQGIVSLQERLRAVPTDWRSFASLGFAYVQQGRITADPSYYPKAEGVLQRSLDINGRDNFDAMVGMGALALARHDFVAALEWGRRALEINPYNGNVYGVVGDAQLELGRYDEAFETFENMLATQPSLAAYARLSYARELQGDVPGAIRAMSQALEAAGTADDRAWASYQLGELWFNSGRLAPAARHYRQGVGLSPSFVPAHAGLAKVAWARGRVDEAIERYTWVVERYPLPEYVIALGDLYAAVGRTDLAEQQYALVRAEQQLFQANGVNVDLELALFDADHGRPQEALETARAEWERRHSVHVADALAWALYANGMYAEAAPYAEKALKLGTPNALFLFHAGMIRLKLGNEGAARAFLSRALRTNPHFSILYAPLAERTLATLGGGP
ncbi:MAG: tetratricopeptide repeat protein [Actinomycetota bacterium]